MNDITRDMAGYGRKGAPIKWPNGAKLAISFVINYEAGAERSPLYGDSEAEVYGGEFALSKKPAGVRNVSMESLFEYESRVGIWRLIDCFDAHQIPLTFFATGFALHQNQALCDYLKASPHEVAGHGWRWIDYAGMSREEEKAHIIQCIDAIKKYTGKAPVGWYTGRRSEHTRDILIELDTFKYDSDSYADDCPYFEANTNHLIVPYSLVTNDFRFVTTPGFSSTNDFFELLKATFHELYQSPRTAMMNIGLHPRLTGQPGRMHAVRQFIDYIKPIEDIWVTTREAIASYWMEAS